MNPLADRGRARLALLACASLSVLASLDLAPGAVRAQSSRLEVAVDGSDGARAFVERQRSELAYCVQRTVPASARGVVVFRGQVAGESLRYIDGHARLPAALPYERLRICVDGVLRGNWSEDAPVGEGVTVTLTVASSDGLAPISIAGVGVSAHETLVERSRSTGVGGSLSGGVGGSVSGGLLSQRQPRARAATRTVPARTSTSLVGTSARDWPTRTILEARAIDHFPRCVASMTEDATISFTVTVGEVGEVLGVRASRSPVQAEARRCLEQEIREIQFIVPEGAARSALEFTLDIHHYPAVTIRQGSFRLAPDSVRVDGAGSIDVERLASIIRIRREALDRCYEYPRGSGAPDGRIELRWSVSESGAVERVDVLRSEVGDAVAQCVVRLFARERVSPPPASAVSVTLTLASSPAG